MGYPCPKLLGHKSGRLFSWTFFGSQSLPSSIYVSSPTNLLETVLICSCLARSLHDVCTRAYEATPASSVRFRDQSLFDCKTVDFAGFVVALVVFVDTPIHRSSDLHGDQALLRRALTIFQRLARGKSCNVASQCYNASRDLMDIADGPGSTVEMEMVVPYFETLSIRRPP